MGDEDIHGAGLDVKQRFVCPLVDCGTDLVSVASTEEGQLRSLDVEDGAIDNMPEESERIDINGLRTGQAFIQPGKVLMVSTDEMNRPQELPPYGLQSLREVSRGEQEPTEVLLAWVLAGVVSSRRVED